MTTQPASPAVERATSILKSMQDRIKKDNALKADLKRALSGEPRHERAVYPLILPYLSETEEKYHLDQWLLVAGLLGYYLHEITPNTPPTFAHSARRLLADNSSKGPERRFRALLDTSIEDIRSPLTAMARLMKAKNIQINYPQLLVDLCRWNHPDQYIQDKWARAFWNAASQDTAKSEES